MLVLSRLIGEEVVVGDNVVVTVVEVRGNRVRLGFAASPEIPIDRREVRRSKERDEEGCQGK